MARGSGVRWRFGGRSVREAGRDLRACVHISATPTAVHVTDDDPPRAILTVDPAAFTALLGLLKSSGGQ
jgi:hypothetical protein